MHSDKYWLFESKPLKSVYWKFSSCFKVNKSPKDKTKTWTSMTPEKPTIHKLSLYTLSLKHLIEYLQLYPHKLLRDLNFFKWRNKQWQFSLQLTTISLNSVTSFPAYWGNFRIGFEISVWKEFLHLFLSQPKRIYPVVHEFLRV